MKNRVLGKKKKKPSFCGGIKKKFQMVKIVQKTGDLKKTFFLGSNKLSFFFFKLFSTKCHESGGEIDKVSKNIHFFFFQL